MIRPTRTTSRWQDMWGTANPSRTSSGLIRPRPLGGAGGRCLEHPFQWWTTELQRRRRRKKAKLRSESFLIVIGQQSVCFTASRL